MGILDALLPEYDHEMAGTRRLLERVPGEKLDWRPHPKSMPLGRLADHIADIPSWVGAVLGADHFDVAHGVSEGEGEEGGSTNGWPGSAASILEKFDTNVRRSRAAIAGTSEEALAEPWSLRKGEEVLFTQPRGAALQSVLINHIIHHRGQLGVYLRLNDVPLPQLYGPTADEPDF
ncbi:MAG: DinB family protein [Gemmatimonadota bacterium]